MRVKAIILMIGLVGASLLDANAQEQEFKKFRVGLGVGYAMPGGKGAKGGVLFALEPGYRLTDNLLINLRYEGAAMVRGVSELDPNNPNMELEVAGARSITINGQYYFLAEENLRPFFGLGFGTYKLAAVKIEGGTSGGSADAASPESKWAFYPRLGFDAGHFTFCIDYNMIPKTEGVNGLEFKNSYLGIRVGAFFGGGRF